MKALVSIVMGSTSDWPVMQKAADLLEKFRIPFEVHALSAHRTPEKVVEFIDEAVNNGVKVIIAGAGGAAHLPGVVAAYTTLPVIGVPCRSSISIEGWDSILSILQMPPGIPVATVGLDNAQNAAILAIQILALTDESIAEELRQYKKNLKTKVVKANEELKKINDFKYKVN
jgi:5-(carboxyamino)imidazole ribonucleotide mutase